MALEKLHIQDVAYITPSGNPGNVSMSSLMDGDELTAWYDEPHIGDPRGYAYLTVALANPKYITSIDISTVFPQPSAAAVAHVVASKYIDVYVKDDTWTGQQSQWDWNRYIGRVFPTGSGRGTYPGTGSISVNAYTNLLSFQVIDVWGSPGFDYPNLSELTIWTTPFSTERVDITSTSTIVKYEIQSAATITVVIPGQSMNSDAYIVDRYSMMTSDALVGMTGNAISSNAVVSNSYTTTLTSDARVLRSTEASQWAFSPKSTRLGMRLSITPSAVPQTNYRKFPFTSPTTQNLLSYTLSGTTSKETKVNDLITSPLTADYVLDLMTANPPLGYAQYDWKYDWVVQTQRHCRYLFEARSADTLAEIESKTFVRVNKDDVIPKEYLKRYHQWRAHVWASGSGDFKLYQFSVKAYVEYPANPLYRSLAKKPFHTTSPIVRGSGTTIITPGGGYIVETASHGGSFRKGSTAISLA
jgi:hypothetical protein